MSDQLAVLPQYLLPKQALTTLMGRLASWRAGGMTTAVIRRFVQHYNVNMSEAANPDIASYATFNDFFTRALHDGARPMATGTTTVSPVDGAISQLGPIAADQIFQAKGHNYSTTALLGGDAALCHVVALTRATLRASDAVARFGGEEFVLLLPGRDLEAAVAVGEALRKAVARERLAHPASPIAPHVTVSIGAASTWPSEDRAMYAAKARGRNCVVAKYVG